MIRYGFATALLVAGLLFGQCSVGGASQPQVCHQEADKTQKTFQCGGFLTGNHASLQLACDSTMLSQCKADCLSQYYLCQYANDDHLPCSDRYNTCITNCAELSDCE